MQSAEIDPSIRYALKLLHSSEKDSAEKIRLLLDDLFKQRGAKTLTSTLSKKWRDEEANATGSPSLFGTPKPEETESQAMDTDDPQPGPSGEPAGVPQALELPPDTPMILSVSDIEDEGDDSVVEEDHLKELEDLMCVVCRRMDVSAKNRLVECSDCHSLYHQECHTPPISEADANDQENSWFCTACSSGKAAVASNSPSPAKSPSSSSSSSYTKSSSSSRTKERSKSGGGGGGSASSSKDSSKSSEKSSKEKKGGGSSSSGATVTPSPNINIITADKRIQNMKKKAAQRKHK